MIHIICKKTLTVLFTLLIVLIGPFSVIAEEASEPPKSEEEIFEYVNKELGFTISPSIAEHKLERGDFINAQIKISKKIAEPIPVGISVSKYIPLASDGRVFNQELKDATDWINIEKPAVILKGEEKKDIPFTIKVPEDASPGTYFTSILFQPVLPASFFNIQSVHIMPYIGGLLVINVQGDDGDNSSPEITQFRYRTSQIKELEYFGATIHNESDYYKEIEGKVLVHDFQNRVVEVLDIEPTRLLPKEDRIVTLQPTEEFELGVYSAKIAISESGDSEQKDEDSINFIAFQSPMEIILLVLIIIVSIVLLFLSGKYLIRLLKKPRQGR